MRKRPSMRRGVVLVPNLITTANLFCGFFSITRSLAGQFEYAAWLVILATIFDFFDGRVARLTRTQSDFGVEYDSLSDLTTFCMAPAILAYQWSLSSFGKFGMAACFLFFACGALRLARFNVQVGGVEKFDFQGLPSPTAGGTLASFVIFFQTYFPSFVMRGTFLFVFAVVVGLLMVSRVRYRSFKKIRRTHFVFLVIIVGIVFLVVSKPELMLFVIGVTYILTGIVEWLIRSPGIKNPKDLIERLYYEDQSESEDGQKSVSMGTEDCAVTSWPN